MPPAILAALKENLVSVSPPDIAYNEDLQTAAGTEWQT